MILASALSRSKPPARTLVFVVTEDWFFASHFLPMVEGARELGLEAAVVTRVRDHRAAIEATGARVIPFEAERRSLNPLAAGREAGRLAAILRREKPDLVHCIALRPILLGGSAALMAGVGRRVYALTGLGFLGAGAARRGLIQPVLSAALKALIRGPLDGAKIHFLFENPDDPRLLGLDPADPHRVTIVGGAGVDPDAFCPAPWPPSNPLKVAVAARMVWSKGIDLAVEAARSARARGAALELSLYGAPDPSNPKAIPESVLQGWGREPGIAWRGRTQDVAAVWREHHVCCLPSRGGEGLPRTLLEGAACGRAIVTTDVPGCRALVRDGVEGFVIPPNDPAALADAFVRLEADPALVRRFGEAARQRVLDGFTERQVVDAVKRMYAAMLAG
ncbi:MAG: Lipid carrier : UDP-N-acetylgalactosaminyltransferase / Alpha-1,3-N-acetylgalactosamine transferase PglA; Putative glycosyltransferase [uncultured Microvirga sp.]|uniref:Lipid carrier: UDP-N-acetylgalactosaminyltransferase / Alpha-1,3-N-acetylgalactosamine transferase PglA Putative glycosyltransferase n=1 Tax=uncultured Microvirga sp. TaxID=412392 RepID=A0A6J4KPX7_9HYPH|nr:MAG: Lipid carrier : UDP-N-acetylgalactosaminyltransferase / Alpha-1,3-N-acetylgalactosamine transferase PglA; Putative glycosyltransferase [uncultured Microvirga sp.]